MKFRKLLYLLILCTFGCSVLTQAQTTYTWNVSRGSWTDPASWSPARNIPANNDVLVFNGSVIANACALNIPQQTIGKLRFINNVTARLVPSAKINGTGTISRTAALVTGSGTLFTTELKLGEAIYTGATYRGEVISIASSTSLTLNVSGTLTALAYSFPVGLTLNDGTTSALDVQAGSTFIVGDNGADPMTIYLAAGSKGQCFGTIRMLYNRHRIYALDSLGMRFKSGAILATDSSFAGNAFGAVGGENTTVFEAGASFQYYVGANPFGLAQPASKTIFSKGSNFYQLSATSPSISGRTFSNFIQNINAIVSASSSNAVNFDSIAILQGQFNLTSSGTMTIGQIYVASGAVLNQNYTGGLVALTGDINLPTGGKINLNGKFTTSPASFVFRGTNGQQRIVGGGELRIGTTIDSILSVRLQNPSGLLLQRSIDMNGASLDLDSGALNLNGNTITLGSNILTAKASQLNGYVTGSGSLTRWYQAVAANAGDSTSLFPLGSGGKVYPVWVFGTASVAGTVSISSFIENNTVTGFGTPFYDSAVTAGIIVQSRLGHAWTLTIGNGLAGTAFGIRLKANVAPGYITNTAQMRVTLTNGIAPGTVSEDGSGTNTQPVAGKLGITAAQLNNTFYMGTNTSTNPLPVKFVDVSVKATDNGNLLQWTTAQEVNVATYQIERLNAAGDFEMIGEVKARRAGVYAFNDEVLLSAAYRVTAVDLNGDLTHSELVSVNRELQEVITVYPNPVNNWLKIGHGTQQLIGQKVKISNQVGKTIEVSVTSEGIDTKDLPSGVYFMQMERDGKVEVIKFVKR